MRHLSVWTKHCSGFPPPATFACALKCCVPPRTCHSPKAHDIVAISPTPQLTTSSPLRIEALEISSSRRPGLERFLMPWSARPHGGGRLSTPRGHSYNIRNQCETSPYLVGVLRGAWEGALWSKRCSIPAGFYRPLARQFQKIVTNSHV